MAVMGYTLALIIAIMQLVNKTSRFRLEAAFALKGDFYEQQSAS